MGVHFNYSFVIVSVHVISLFVPIYGQTVQDAKNLRTQLFTTDSYDFRVRPIANQSDFVSKSIFCYTMFRSKEFVFHPILCITYFLELRMFAFK